MGIPGSSIFGAFRCVLKDCREFFQYHDQLVRDLAKLTRTSLLCTVAVTSMLLMSALVPMALLVSTKPRIDGFDLLVLALICVAPAHGLMRLYRPIVRRPE
jgi:hypothetical protein